MSTETKISFDEYSDSLRIATATYLKAGPTIGHWSRSWRQLSRSAFQFGTDGSGRIAHGLTAPNATVIFVQLTRLRDAVQLDGHMTKWQDISVFPPSTHFTFVSDHHLSWLAIALLPSGIPDFENSGHLLNHKALITLTPGAADRYIDASIFLKRELDGTPEPDVAANHESRFLRILDETIPQFENRLLLPSDYNEASEAVVVKALEYARARPGEPITVEELVTATNVEYRTLLRAFRRYLNIGPKQYLKLRQLDIVRLALRQSRSSAQDSNVTAIQATYGVTEFGRFAAEYKRLYHETPSQTFKRALKLNTPRRPGPLLVSRACIAPDLTASTTIVPDTSRRRTGSSTA